MSRYEPLPYFGYSQCGSDGRLNDVMEQDNMELQENLSEGLPPISEDPRQVVTNGWKDNESYHSGRSDDEIEYSVLHCPACKNKHCEYNGNNNKYRERTRESPPSMRISPPITYPELPKSTSGLPL